MAYPKDDSGQVQVDFVWGNLPLQPNELRPGGAGQLNPALDNHTIATRGYSNYPGFIPNYDGEVQYAGNYDGPLLNDNTQGDAPPFDAGLEVVVPNVRGLSPAAAQDALNAVSLGTLIQYFNYDVASVVSVGKTVTVTLDSVVSPAGTSNVLRVGDVVSVSYNDGAGFSGVWANVKLTKISGTSGIDIAFNLATAPSPALDFDSTGFVFNNNTFVAEVGFNAGEIANVDEIIDLFVLNGD